MRIALWSTLALVGLLSLGARPVMAQGKIKSKHYVVSSDRAVTITRTVLLERGYKVVRVERLGGARVVYYRRGSMGNGKGKGPIRRMVIRSVRDQVFFEDAEPDVLVDIDVRLRL